MFCNAVSPRPILRGFRLVLTIFCVALTGAMLPAQINVAGQDGPRSGVPSSGKDHNPKPAMSHGCPMFQSANAVKSVRIYDPRLKYTTLRCATLENQIVMEGDIRLGTVDQASRSFITHVRSLVAEAAKSPSVQTYLNTKPTEQAVLTKMQSADQLPLADGIRQADAAMKVLSEIDNHEAARTIEQHTARIRLADRKKYAWPGGIVPYIIDEHYGTPKRILEAIDHWHAKTKNVRFVPYVAEDPPRYANWVRFVPAGHTVCQADVGKQSAGEQLVLLGRNCLVPQVIHELGHVVGLFHEQSRQDRDKFLKIDAGNIESGQRYNFDVNLAVENSPKLTFDYDSIMLYPPLAFAKLNSTEPTMRRKDFPDNLKFGLYVPGLGGIATELSKDDVKTIEQIYETQAKPPP
jgi:hypothetical protein